MDGPPHPFADLELARLLERAEAVSSARFVEARQRVSPASGAAWKEVAGAYALYDGAASPVTQTFGLGLFEPATESSLGELEDFFTERGADVNHEVSPLAGVDCYRLLARRGYEPVELTSMLYRKLPAEVSGGGAVETVMVTGKQADLWAQVCAEGWSDVAPEWFEWILDVGRVVARKQDSPCWLAMSAGRPVAGAAMSICGPVAHLAGAATIPAARRQGAQLALLAARLTYAAQQGCEIACLGAQPGSASQRNAERHHFRIAYTRLKWRLRQAERG